MLRWYINRIRNIKLELNNSLSPLFELKLTRQNHINLLAFPKVLNQEQLIEVVLQIKALKKLMKSSMKIRVITLWKTMNTIKFQNIMMINTLKIQFLNETNQLNFILNIKIIILIAEMKWIQSILEESKNRLAKELTLNNLPKKNSKEKLHNSEIKSSHYY